MGDAAKFRSLHAAAVAARNAGDFSALFDFARELKELGESTDDAVTEGWGHYFDGVRRMQYNDADGAEIELKHARNLFEDAGERFDAARVTASLAALAMDIRLAASEARRLLDNALPIIGESGDLHLFAVALGNFAELLRAEGDYRRALQCCSDAAGIFTELDDAPRAGWQFANVALCYALLRDFTPAFEAIDRAYQFLQQDLNPRWIAWHLDVCFVMVAKLLLWEEAAKLLGLVDLFRDEVDLTRPLAMIPWFSEAIERVTRAIPKDRLDELLQEGEKLSLEGAHLLVMTCAPESSRT